MYADGSTARTSGLHITHKRPPPEGSSPNLTTTVLLSFVPKSTGHFFVLAQCVVWQLFDLILGAADAFVLHRLDYRVGERVKHSVMLDVGENVNNTLQRVFILPV